MNKTADRIDISHLPKTTAVYRVVCVPTGECYVGGSVNVRKRCEQHASKLAYGEHHSIPMQKRYREHGTKAFACEVLDACDLLDLAERETAWISRLSPAFNQNRRAGEIRQPPAARADQTKPTKSNYVPAPGTLTHADRKLRRQQMAEAIADGKTVTEVTAIYGVTAATVSAAMREYGVSAVKARRAERNKRIIELKHTGKTGTEIAAEMGISESVVSDVLRAAGLSDRRGRRLGVANPSATFVPRHVWESLDWTKYDADIARELLVSRERARQVRQMLGHPKPRDRRRRSELLSA